MRITVVLGPFYAAPPGGCGAVEKVWYQLAHWFADAGHCVRLIAKGSPADYHRQPGGPDIVALRGYRATRSIWLNLAKDFLYGLQVRKLVGECDVVVTNSFWLPVALRFDRARYSRMVVHVARFPKYQMWLYGAADVLQAISTAVAREIARQTPQLSHKVAVLPYPIDLDTYHPPLIARERGAAPTLLYVGRVHPEKGLDLLIDAFREVIAGGSAVRLRIVGPAAVEYGGGGAAYIRRLRERCAALPVDFRDAIRDPAALAEEYRAAHAFCYPSLSERGEALGLAVLEAMATGLPVIVSDLACFTDFVEPERDGLVFNHRAPDARARLAAALKRVLGEPALAGRLGRNAAEKATEFRFDRVAARYLKLLGEVAAS